MPDQCCCKFEASYELSQLPAIRELERDVLGCDYGGTSWTTRSQADHIHASLALKPGTKLLDVGAGAGWPGLLLSDISKCELTLLDMPLNALRQATRRAAKDAIADRVTVVAGSGDALPFADGSFDCISHSDVLCCLPEKLIMLQECRRVASSCGRMHFSVIRPASNLSQEEQQYAIETGPPFVASDDSYVQMLQKSNWKIIEQMDVTTDYQNSLQSLVTGLSSNSPALREAFGADELQSVCKHRQAQLELAQRRVLIREIFVCSASD